MGTTPHATEILLLQFRDCPFRDNTTDTSMASFGQSGISCTAPPLASQRRSTQVSINRPSSPPDDVSTALAFLLTPAPGVSCSKTPKVNCTVNPVGCHPEPSRFPCFFPSQNLVLVMAMSRSNNMVKS